MRLIGYGKPFNGPSPNPTNKPKLDYAYIYGLTEGNYGCDENTPFSYLNSVKSLHCETQILTITRWLNKTNDNDKMPVTTPHVVSDMLSPDAINDGAEHLHPLLKVVEVGTGQTEDYHLCLSFVNSVRIDERLKLLAHCHVDNALFTSGSWFM